MRVMCPLRTLTAMSSLQHRRSALRMAGKAHDRIERRRADKFAPRLVTDR